MNRARNRNLADAASVFAGASFARIGIVTSYDPKAYAVKVKVMPEGIESGWLKIMPLLAGPGAGFGFYLGAEVGVQAVIVHQEGDANNGICLGFLNDDEEDTPPEVPTGEIWAMHKSGSYLKFTTDGKISMHGTVLIRVGDLGQTVKRLITDTFQALFNNHVHSNVAAGGANSGKPTTQIDDTHMTSILKGN